MNVNHVEVRSRRLHSGGALWLCVLFTLGGYGIDVWSMSEEREREYFCSPDKIAFGVTAAEQKKYTVIPLQKMYIDPSSGPEPLIIEQTLTLEEITYPFFPGPMEVWSMSMGLLQISENYGTKGKVRISKPGTDYLVEYFFKYDECWRLYRIEDWSQAPRRDAPNEERYCARENFMAFLDAFSGSVEVQKKYTVIPFRYAYHFDNLFSDLELLSVFDVFVPVEEMLALDELHYPLFPSYREVVSEHTFLDLEVSGTQAKVSKQKPDTGYSVRYYFEHDRCWRLHRIENWST